MKRLRTLIALGTAFVLGLVGYKFYGLAAAAPGAHAVTENQIIKSVLMDAASTDLSKLPALTINKYVLPPLGIDVMKIRMEGTYTVNGVGTDRVELSGWMACVHREPRPAVGGHSLTWKNSIIDTEFVAFDISGESKIFGPVRAYLDPTRVSKGRTGAVNIAFGEKSGRKAFFDEPAPVGCCPPTDTCPPSPECQKGCLAAMNLIIEMPQLGLKMSTREPIRNYSIVDTVPPVGTTPSFTLEPTDLILDGRVVGTLQDSTSKFREVVMKVPFNNGDAFVNGAPLSLSR